MLNSVIMMGRLTDNPELRQTPNGVNVCSFTIAVERSYAKQGTERQTDFFDVVAWRNTAEFVSRFFQKGRMIAVQGSMETRTYDDRNGIRRKAYTIVADNVFFADSKRDGNTAPSQAAPGFDDSQVPPAFENAGDSDFREIEAADDDLPF